MSISKIVDKNIKNFIATISKQYNIEIIDLTKIWNGNELPVNDNKLPVTNSIVKDKLPPVKIDTALLLNCDKNELVALCKIHGYKFSGAKSLLINRLLGKEDIVVVKTVKKTKILCVKSTPILKKLTASVPTIVIRRNKFNKYEHLETGFIFDSERKIVIGKQNSDGSIDSLTEKDIDSCNAFKFQFDIPSNLDSTLNVLDVKVADLSDDEEIGECDLIPSHEESEESECDSDQE